MPTAPKPLPTKQAAIIAALGALLVVAVLYVPALLPLCQALNFCPPDNAVDTVYTQ